MSPRPLPRHSTASIYTGGSAGWDKDRYKRAAGFPWRTHAPPRTSCISLPSCCVRVSDRWQESLKASRRCRKRIHIPATVLFDVREIYPQYLMLQILRDAFSDWFHVFLYLEVQSEAQVYHPVAVGWLRVAIPIIQTLIITHPAAHFASIRCCASPPQCQIID